MKAITYREYGPPDVLRLEEIEKPAPAEGEVLIRIRAASVNAMDCHFMRGEPRFIRLMTGVGKPRNPRLGVDVAGIVEGVGPKVTDFKPGDEVFGVCRGAFAEYACAPGLKVAIKSANVSFEQAAALPVACVTALLGLRDKGKVRAGQKVLINGAGGGVGTFAVQIAKHLGAEVTAVTTAKKLELVRGIGADHVIDYTRDDFTQNGKRYDAIFDLGSNHPWSEIKHSLTASGTRLFVGGPREAGLLRPFVELFKGILQSPFVSQKVQLVSGRVTRDDLILMDKLVADGKIIPAIDGIYPLSDVANAVRRLEGGSVGGKVVITIPQ